MGDVAAAAPGAPGAAALKAEVGGIGRSLCLVGGILVESVDWEKKGDEKREGVPCEEEAREAENEKKE